MSCSIRARRSRRARRANRADEIAGFGRVHAGRRLVEHQDRRLRGERARDLEPALIAVRQRPTRARRGRAARCRRAPARRARGVIDSRPGRAIRAGGEVRAHVERVRRGGCSDRCARSRRARCGAAAGRRAGAYPSAMVPPLERRDAGRRVDERRLPGAVGTDEPERRARIDRERDGVQRLDAAVAHPDALEDERVSLEATLRARATDSARPPGAKRITTEQDRGRP